MGAAWRELPEIRDLNINLLRARLERGLNQEELARKSKLSQAQVSLFEAGIRLPSLEQFLRLARALDVPLQALLTGEDRPGIEIKDLAVELRRLGASDLWVADATVPGAVRRPEEAIALAASAVSPDPRVVETLPALLSWNEIHPVILEAYGIATRTRYRLAWLADIALTIERQKGFPGGCRRDPLERFLKAVELPPDEADWDDLGRPARSKPTSPVWRRWKVNYDATVNDFERRAKELARNREAEARLPMRRRIKSGTRRSEEPAEALAPIPQEPPDQVDIGAPRSDARKAISARRKARGAGRDG